MAKESPSYPEVSGEGITFCLWEREGSVASDFPVSGRAFKFRLGAFLTAWDRHGGASRPPIPGGDCNPSLDPFKKLPFGFKNSSHSKI